MGVELDIGTLPDADEVTQGDTADPERLANVVSRIVARVADRVGFIRNISRHFEGENKRAGVLSDILSAAWLLYRRNPEAVEAVLSQAATSLRQRKETKTTGGNSNATK
jgi:hypothetical protein